MLDCVTVVMGVLSAVILLVAVVIVVLAAICAAGRTIRKKK